jgi:hypothetical protein
VVQEADQRLIKAAVLFANGNIDKPASEARRFTSVARTRLRSTGSCRRVAAMRVRLFHDQETTYNLAA